MFLYFLKEKDVKLLNNYDIKGLSINFREHRNDKDREEKINKYVHLIFGKKMFNPNFKSSMELYDSLYNFIKTNFKNIFIDSNIEKQTFVDNWKNDLNILDSAYNYLTYKILKISATYDRWNKHFYVDHKTNNNLVNSNELLNEIYLTQKERDHVTLKLWQCIEFIKNPTVYLTKKNFVELKDIVPKEKSLDGYYCILPPSFMNPQLVFNKDSDEEIKLNQISSGEKQSIYSFSYIIYHIKNVLSKSIEPKYKNFCLIFDEAELYMHPEFQRTFIFNLVKLLNNCNFDNIKSINILIATHSPYIIAEIPTKNILSLEKPNNKNKLPENISYCANYYDLMKNTFLLDFSISELAKHNIKKIIDFCNSDEMQIDEKTKNKFDLIIENIADPYLKNTLKTMFSTKINR